VKIKAVLDTNVLISGMFWKGPPFEILNAWQRGRFTLALSMPILEEYRRVVAEVVTEHRSGATGPILELLEVHSQMVEPVSFRTKICDDPDDDKFLAAAVAAGADYVVTGDLALLRIGTYEGIEIVRPAKFFKIISL
jgi:putative PIN family toxin of toxin-antitoxin system